MLFTVLILALFYFPEMITYPIITKNPKKLSLIWIGLNWTQTFLNMNSFVNPFWYCYRLRAIRRAVFSLVGCACDVSPGRDDNGHAGNANALNIGGRRSLSATNGTFPLGNFSKPRP